MLKKIKSNSGFTIVELLIVIVVIAILAAISIVAYNGVQNRSKAAAGQQLAAQVIKKFEALNAVKGAYYSTNGAGTIGTAINTYANTAPVVAEAVLDTPASVVAAGSGTTHNLSGTIAANGGVVSAYACTAGANVWYWDYNSGSGTAVKMTAGAGC